MKILVIDDDLILATGLKFQLKKILTCDVVIVDDAISATKKLESEDFDLVFCDIRMPHIDGVTLLSKHVDAKKLHGVVIVSAVDNDILDLTYDMCKLNGFRYVNVLKKPFNLENLELVLSDFFNEVNLEQKKNASSKLSKHDLERAFLEDCIFLLYQPQFDFRTGNLVGVEALVRIDFDGEIYSPNAFIDLIESMSLSNKLFEVVLDKATTAISMISSDIRLSVNITKSLLEIDICNKVIDVCTSNGFPLTKLCLELTEEQAYNVSPAALANLARLRLNNVELSLDDFGKGYASIEQLIDLPISELKIDRRFIKGIISDYKRQQLTSMSLQLAQSLGLNFVAEGVEDKETWEFMRDLGADICQGFYLSKPISAIELHDMVKLLNSSLKEHITSDHMVIYYAADSLKYSAFYKLLSKELDGYHLIWISNEEQFKSAVRDLPIDIVIVDGNLTSLVDFILEHNARSHFYIIDSELKSDYESIEEHCTVVKSSTLANETVKNLIRKLKSNDDTQFSESMLLSKLSSRELSVAKMLVAGFTNKYIAYELDINQKTVSTYKTRVLTKLGVKNIIELVKLFGGDPN